MEAPTPTTHHLKIHPQYYEEVLEFRKSFELRKNDRDFKEGDMLCLQEWDPQTGEYTGEELNVGVIYILKDDVFGLEEGYCILGISLPLPTPVFTLDQCSALVANCLSIAIQGKLSHYHAACAEVVVFYLPMIAHHHGKDPVELLQQQVKNIRDQQAKNGLMKIPYDPKFQMRCITIWKS